MNKVNLNLYRANLYNKIGIKETPHYGEDGVIQKIFTIIGVNESPYIVEFGETRSLGTTTRAFKIDYKSNSLYFTGSINIYSKLLNIVDIFFLVIKKKNIHYFNFLFNLPKQIFCTEHNILEIFTKYLVPKQIDILCIDIDSNDYFIAKKILDAGYRPSLLILEYNPNLPINESLAIKKIANYQNKRIYGASFLAMYSLASQYDYQLIHISGFCNLFFVKKDYANNFELPDISEEITDTKEKVITYIEKYCKKGFIPSWLNSELLTEYDIAFFEKV